jgi:ankyrin repeat protein
LLQTPLVIAVKYNQSVVAGLLLRAGAALNAAEDRGHTALHMAAEGGYTQVIKQLLAAGANLEAGDTVAGWTPLTYAAWHG